MTDDELARILFALSEPLRRRVLEAVADRADATVGQICDRFEVSRFAIMRHLNILEEAGLIRREAAGRERRVRLSERRFEDVIAAWARNLRREAP